MMLVRFYSLLHKFVIIFLLPEILNKLFFAAIAGAGDESIFGCFCLL